MLTLPTLALVALTCVPTPAIDTTVIDSPAVLTVPAVDAQGTPTLTVANPDYIPAVPGTEDVTHIVHHEAVIEHKDETRVHHDAVIVHHEEISRIEHKYELHGGQGEIWIDNIDYKYVDSCGKGYDHKPDSGEFYERTQKTRTVIITAAYDEIVTEAWDEITPASDTVITEAWDETIVDSPAIPGSDAVGSPTIEIPNPDYIPAILEIPGREAVTHIEHTDAIICPEIVSHPVSVSAETLAQTGGSIDPWFLGIAGFLLVGGTSAMLLGMSSTKIKRRIGTD